ncbi:class I SAM-dependent methyltransferase [Mesorhizobium sp. M1A.F.Ca.ET.072.01.1.1]|uniref:class I SAM-dependent DNA methyltransferase n=1 Tax=Mesorhizobium sp. M1A.F.Ca.ET.072.01.1.1 TaxID=2496753 RepID=UPI000FD3111C|nr:class I SAM-dependent methyltransferase [Mesorhizobium sp. M1A.F.Ca.ET.072.01.1.1]RUW54080.1 class I SAM-dependent methyltransferase [Mesorhizobium sp. M1A.F.Ca.ET.072.01.1.1]
MKSSAKQIAFEEAAQKRIKESHALNGDANRLAKYYRGWADSYELDVEREQYCGPIIVAELTGALQTAYVDRERAVTTILDAGCGTGLVGMELERLGFRSIDGFDLSESMVEKARETGVYRDVRDYVDLNSSLTVYPDASYDMTVCCGVFTVGHVRPDGLRELARVTRPQGFVVVSTRKSYAEATSFEDEVLRLQEAGVVEPLHCLSDGRYLEEEDAHYWALRVVEKPKERRL